MSAKFYFTYFRIDNFQLEHPNIIEVYEVYDNTDYFFIVMEYMEGG